MRPLGRTLTLPAAGLQRVTPSESTTQRSWVVTLPMRGSSKGALKTPSSTGAPDVGTAGTTGPRAVSSWWA